MSNAGAEGVAERKGDFNLNASRLRSDIPLALALSILVALCGGLSACTNCCSQEHQTSPDGPSAADKPAQSSSTNGVAPLAVDSDDYPAAMRRRDFQTAARLIDAAPQKEQALPEVRLARARCALALDDVSTALEQVTGLDESFPEFAPLAREVVQQCASKTQDVTVLEHLLGTGARGGHSEGRLVLAAAYEAGGQPDKTLSTLSGVISSLLAERRLSSTERDRLARATQARARLLEDLEQNDAAAKDYFWLSTEAVTHPAARFADQHYERLSGKKLTAEVRLERAEELSSTGNIPSVEEELRRLAEASGSPVGAGPAQATLAWTVYASRTDYERASQLFARAAELEPKKASHHLYYSAKSLARAHQHARAIKVYQRVANMQGEYADHARYNSARLSYIDCDFVTAIAGYQRYLSSYKGGAHREAAGYELALSQLAIGKHEQARSAFGALVRSTSSDRERARYLQLEALAADGEGKTETAQALGEKVIRDRPLSLSALLAAARLKRAKLPVPPPLTPLAVDERTTTPPLQPELPDLVRRLARVGLDEEAEQALRDRERELRGEYAGRSLEALCQLYGQLEPAHRRYQVAQTAASWATLSHEPDANNRWQWECIYPMPYLDIVEREAKLRSVPTALVYAVMRQESAFRPQVESPAKAVGLMQIIPPTARQIAAELGDHYEAEKMLIPAVNIRYGVYYLRRLLDMLGDRPELTVAAYNAGPHAVESWLRGGEKLPLDLFVAKIPYGETRNYVYRVMGNYARYQYLLEGTIPSLALDLPSGLEATAGAY